MWHIYNLIAVSDLVKSSSYRKVAKVSDTGSSVQNKIKITVSLSVELIDFDVHSSEIRLKGKNVEERSAFAFEFLALKFRIMSAIFLHFSASI